MGDNIRDYISHPDEKGSINISEEVVAVIAANAALDTEGVVSLSAPGGRDGGRKTSMKGLRLTVEEETIQVDVGIVVEMGVSISGTAAKVQEAIVSNIESMTGFSVKEVNVHVSGVSSERPR